MGCPHVKIGRGQATLTHRLREQCGFHNRKVCSGKSRINPANTGYLGIFGGARGEVRPLFGQNHLLSLNMISCDQPV